MDIDISKVESKLQFEFAKDVKASFKQYIDAGLGAKHVQQLYSVNKTGQIVSGLIKVPSVHLEQVLSRSGPDGLYIKEKVRRSHPIMFPFALIHHSQLKEGIDDILEHIGKRDDFCGVHRSSAGSLSLRVKPESIAKARKDLCIDSLFTEFNETIVPSKFFQVQGFPTGTTAIAAASALHEWGWDVLPIKDWAMSPWMQCWLVGATSEPPGEYICIQDQVVTVVTDGVKQNKPDQKKLVDVVFEQDAWARYVRSAQIDNSSNTTSYQRPAQPAQVAAPKVQQVVVDRIESSETAVMSKVTEITDTLRNQVRQELTLLKQQQQSSDAKTQEIAQQSNLTTQKVDEACARVVSVEQTAAIADQKQSPPRKDAKKQ